MSTLSIPIGAELEKFIDKMVGAGHAANKADVVRKALTLLAEREAVRAVMEATREPSLKGNLKDLLKRI